MIKILKHHTALNPIYIAVSEDQRFYTLYGERLIGSHCSIGVAIQSVANEGIYGVSDKIDDWERITSDHNGR